jgi:hypothetical protein
MGEDRAAQIGRKSRHQQQPIDHLHWRAVF